MSTKPEKRPLTHSWSEYLETRLAKNPKEAVDLLNLALEGGEPEVFLTTLRHVMNAQKRRVADVAAASGLHRVSLYKALSKKGNPQLSTLQHVLSALDMQLKITTVPKRKRRSA